MQETNSFYKLVLDINHIIMSTKQMLNEMTMSQSYIGGIKSYINQWIQP